MKRALLLMHVQFMASILSNYKGLPPELTLGFWKNRTAIGFFE